MNALPSLFCTRRRKMADSFLGQERLVVAQRRLVVFTRVGHWL
jgi:hypothetical protein